MLSFVKINRNFNYSQGVRRGSSHILHNTRAEHEEERLLLLAFQKLTQWEIVTVRPMKSYYSLNSQFLQWRRCLLQPSQLPFPSLKRFSSLYCAGTCLWLTVVADPDLHFLLEKKNWSSVLGQQVTSLILNVSSIEYTINSWSSVFFHNLPLLGAARKEKAGSIRTENLLTSYTAIYFFDVQCHNYY